MAEYQLHLATTLNIYVNIYNARYNGIKQFKLKQEILEFTMGLGGVYAGNKSQTILKHFPLTVKLVEFLWQDHRKFDWIIKVAKILLLYCYKSH